MMIDAKMKYKEAVARCLQTDDSPIMSGEIKGYNKELVESLIVPSTWSFHNANKSFGILKRLKSKIITNDK